jgi:uncharacterized C2H2 Zn-finger protein
MNLIAIKETNRVTASMNDEGILHNEDPLVPKAMQIDTMETGEKFVQCLWCPCRFTNIKDFNQHVEALGKNQEQHKENWTRRLRSTKITEDSDSY